MTNEDFIKLVENAHSNDVEVLKNKEKEYSAGKDRLDQFYIAATLQRITPTEALIGMMTKHITSIVDMSKHPDYHSQAKWDGKLTDLRNYTYLLGGLVIDMRG